MAGSSSVVLFGLAKLRRNAGWQRLENWKWRERLSFTSFGVECAIQVTEPAAMVPVKLRLPPGWREIGGTELEPGYSIVVGNEAASGGLQGLHLLFRGRSLISAAYKLEPVLGALESELDRFVASQAAPQWIFVRAGVVGWKGRAIIVAGPDQSGTSNLVAALLRGGASYYSDQYAVLDGDGRVHPYARPLWLCAGAHRSPTRYHPEGLGARAGLEPLQPGILMLAQFRGGERARLSRIDAAAAAEELLGGVLAAEAHREAARSAIMRSLRAVRIVKGVRGEADEAVRWLLK